MSKALTNWVLGSVPIQTNKKGEIPPYPDSGVDYAGYSKQEVVNGWKLRQQNQFWYKLRYTHPWAAAATTIFSNNNKALFISKIMIDCSINNVATGTVEVHFSPTGNTADSFTFHRPNLAAREVAMAQFDFDPPIRFDRLCNVILSAISTTAGEQINVLVWGFTEEL